MKIGEVKLENPYILAPMAGVTDLPFRLLCKEQGAGLLCMEMISAKALQYKNKNTKTLLAIHPEEYPVSLQLFGSEPDIISEIAKMIEPLPFQILDINMGCPVPKIVKNGEGSALMLRPELVYEIVSKTAKAIKKPVTVKIRKGFDDAHINAVEIAKVAEEAGAKAVAVHGRTREQYYSGKLPERPSPEVIRETMLRHARLQMEYKGDFIGIREMRKHVAWYTKGMKGSSKLRDEINRTESYEELEALLYEKIK